MAQIPQSLEGTAWFLLIVLSAHRAHAARPVPRLVMLARCLSLFTHVLNLISPYCTGYSHSRMGLGATVTQPDVPLIHGRVCGHCREHIRNCYLSGVQVIWDNITQLQESSRNTECDFCRLLYQHILYNTPLLDDVVRPIEMVWIHPLREEQAASLAVTTGGGWMVVSSKELRQESQTSLILRMTAHRCHFTDSITNMLCHRNIQRSQRVY